jgi:hypothetical protein
VGVTVPTVSDTDTGRIGRYAPRNGPLFFFCQKILKKYGLNPENSKHPKYAFIYNFEHVYGGEAVYSLVKKLYRAVW